ncbi:type I-F CRISPR-associated protein Csy1 [Acinetobacter sp. MD2]|uniref:type I-F CRISPR-associated protein Csy1 n=1 Tax=Acinetobacter sp. MD2 TaxID=2600066 RepID=UPI002D1EBDF4|nr:type I-F CRISPR-associated protein Csy1 [Acinetobacter sp. MD2]MEB3767917.1 type I-F CRISPR-associated protein Csy1 [Acinetobacter sp. MD2]
MPENITAFFNDRKDLWLKDRLKKAKDDEIADLQQQATTKFSLAEWLPDAAKRVGQLSMVSHPSKFSHPSAKTSSVIAKVKAENDGYLRSGNVDYPLDVFGNAAAMDVFKFLSIELSNGKTVLDNFEESNDVLIQYISTSSLKFEDLRHDFLKIKVTDTTSKTDHLVKQVYFPIKQNQYHLLSILTPSGLITELKQRVDKIRFSDETKQAKENRKKNESDAIGYADIYDLTVTAYGGTQPQNVSVLNSQNAGRAYLLASVPPSFENRKVTLPTRDFFSQCLYAKGYKDTFKHLQELIRKDLDGVTGQRKNNISIRKDIDKTLRKIIEQILFTAFCIRQYKQQWSLSASYQNLPLSQRIWLDDCYQEEREENDSWFEEISHRIAKWILDVYQDKNIVPQSYQLGDGELRAVKEIVRDLLNEDKEFF